MALIACKECGSNVSDAALKCPNCGVQLQKSGRSILGKILKFIFIVFNLLMIFWLVSYFINIGELSKEVSSDAEMTGAAIGATLGTGFLMTIWVMGDIILGLLVLLTRPKN